MKLILAPLVVLLASCGMTPNLNRYDQNSQAYKQCSYEAKSNTPSNLGVVEGVFRERELTDMCMKAKGY